MGHRGGVWRITRSARGTGAWHPEQRDARNNTDGERKEYAEETASEAVKGALLISGADRRKYGKLKDELANNYLLGTDQYPDTFEKALRIL